MRNPLDKIILSPLARKYIAITLLAGGFLTLSFSIIEIYFLYQSELSQIEAQQLRLEKSILPSLSQAIWEFRENILMTILESILTGGFVTGAELSADVYDFKVGTFSPHGDALRMKMLLTYNFEAKEQLLGHLIVSTDLAPIQREMLHLFLIKIFTNFIKTGIMLIVSFFAFYFVVNRHLFTITHRLKANADSQTYEPIYINRKDMSSDDELDHLLTAFNLYSKKLWSTSEVQKTTLTHTATGYSHRPEQDVERINSALEVLEIGFSCFDETGNQLYTSPLTHLAHKSLNKLHSAYCTTPNAAIRHAMQSGLNVNLLTHDYAKNGGMTCLIEVSHKGQIWIIHYVFGATGSLAIMSLDHTELKRAQKEIAEDNRLQSVGMIASSVAHEFNNGLAVLRSLAELEKLNQEKNNLDEANAIGINLELFFQEIDRLSSATQEILASTRETWKNRKLATAILESQTNEFAEHIVPKHMSFNFVTKASGIFYVPEHKLLSAIRNLIKNAVESSPREVNSITVQVRPTLPNDIDDQIKNCALTIDVLDRGPGVPSEIINRLFEPFVSTKQFGKGTGLGLWSVSNFIQQSNGKILYKPRKGGGSCFTIIVPSILTQKSKQIDSTTQRPNIVQSHPVRLTGSALLIEDEQVLNPILVYFLEQLGLDCVGVSSVREAKNYIHQNGPADFVICDDNLPDGRGSEALKAHWAANGNDKVVIITGDVSSITMTKDNITVLEKPFKFDKLKKILIKLSDIETKSETV